MRVVEAHRPHMLVALLNAGYFARARALPSIEPDLFLGGIRLEAHFWV
jgi:hypothetical protein